MSLCTVAMGSFEIGAILVVRLIMSPLDRCYVSNHVSYEVPGKYLTRLVFSLILRDEVPNVSVRVS